MIGALLQLAIMVRVLRMRLALATIHRVTVRVALVDLADCMARDAATAAAAGAHWQAGTLGRYADELRAIAGGAR